ncbi:MAG: lipoprotein [Prevotella sp.]|nr:lipoprotein [Prevotella sp.]
MRKIIFLLTILLTLAACGKDESVTFTEPFIRVSTEGGAASTVVRSNVKNINTYYIYLSSKPLSANLEVNYEVIVGDGLQAGVDFELVNPSNQITFLPGIYAMPIRIRWMEHTVDPTKDNTLTIRLVSNSMNLAMGYPGPDAVQRQLVITKENE